MIEERLLFHLANLIAGRLLLSRACFLFRFAPVFYK
jgi:hypothetical protein